MQQYTFEDMQKMDRGRLGNLVPLELFRTIRLIGMNQGLPMGGKGTTLTVGRKIGESLPVSSVDDLLALFEELKIGIPQVVYSDDHRLNIAVEDCFCKGLPTLEEEKMICDLEGAILEGALSKLLGRRVSVREIKCNATGHEYCEYEVKL
ncbi:MULTISPECIES: V4R domain-containing protein [unclassified Paenibacillus]|uniref:V4R domain-containing protein n=1 Tax=unclassified Paenibacillus TaxID=185978 RepID=UPI002405AB60|nr:MULTISPECIES: V4R domain-containing protein [unclassified Paenibacillus]MDF9844437.1 putative hydrocarbon binding protein [Paenibacillus sp. PastF-2]MDF9851041.1 putative hydrocarbon binding protein [Paenibacillus sp. PastM-2]MDF9857630.1 putative hydrocarbon binding protein [Paenibacillus sp. PastF-1]MDH6482879.1 putative hydrocarbon binding protein [Paenibacillus sp. PastH-2]MDH6510304.1 putative hydrocarbon binding protein [Paenibacillus sp. PastM-3]